MTNQRDQNKVKATTEQKSQKPVQSQKSQQALLKPYQANPTKIGKKPTDSH